MDEKRAEEDDEEVVGVPEELEAVVAEPLEGRGVQDDHHQRDEVSGRARQGKVRNFRRRLRVADRLRAGGGVIVR